MPNHHPSEEIEILGSEIDELQRKNRALEALVRLQESELHQLRLDNAALRKPICPDCGAQHG
jgi:hypothetical protein